MNGDDDIRIALPDPPPPSPKRREANIAAAMARFDGTEEAPRARIVSPARSTGWWAKIRRPYAGPVVAAALIATITLPFAWVAYDQRGFADHEQAAPPVRDAKPVVEPDAAQISSEHMIPAPIAVGVDPANVKTPAPRASETVAAPGKRTELAQADISPPTVFPSPPPPPPAPPPPAMKVAERASPVVQGRALRPSVQDAPAAISSIASEAASPDRDRSIVVTGSRRAPGKADRRGDWNACTVNDPAQAVAKCKKLANRAAKEVRAPAADRLSEGLKQAWTGDIDGAIRAFDQAIAVAPGLSVAYLNRGLAYARRGDDERAIADLDRAVQYAPRSARAYYNRSVVLRNSGADKRAAADEKRAIELDPQYEAIIRQD